MKWKPKEIRLPLNKMAGCPWNLLDARGARVAWCGYDNDHERTGELIANDILNLIAIGEAVGDLLDIASDNLLKAQAEIDRLNKVVDQQWLPIETAPKDGTRIIVFFPGVSGGVYEVAWTFPHYADEGDETWCVDDQKHGPWPLRRWCEHPTHWMPLPAPPVEVKEDEQGI